MHTEATPSLDTLRDAARTGGPEAQVRLAHGLVEQGALGEAFQLFREAGTQGHAEAKLQCARMLLYGLVGGADGPATAVPWLEDAERAGSAAAAGLLASVALGGVVMDRDFAAIGHRLLAAAKGKDLPSMRALAMHFGRERDNPDAMRQSQSLLEQAAGLGDPISAALLCERVRHGEMAAPADLLTWQALAAQGRIPVLPAIAAAPVTARVSRPLRLDLESTLQAAAVIKRSDAPRVATVDGLLTAEECRYLIILGAPWLKRARVLNPQTGEGMEHPVRTSEDVSFDPLLEDFQLRLLQLRMAAAIGLDFTCAEQLILLRYQPGQEYRPHRDYLPQETLNADRPQAGQRSTTICCYLNEVAEGGGTAFPKAELVVEPRAGRAVAFRNTDDAGRPDPDSQHAGMPVLQGEKWLATLWLRQRRYRTF